MKTISRILKSEALAFLIAAIWAYYLIGASWWLFLLFFLVPDIFMVGYLKDSVLGAFLYNVSHTYIFPFLLLCAFVIFHLPILLPISIIWMAHISMDRMLGYGLKFSTGFKDTHLGKIGK
jgi:hypothetical protein